MPIIHQSLEGGGGEEYLGWARGQESRMRLLGVSSRRFDLGDAEVEINIVGDVSHIRVRGGTWVAYPCKFDPHIRQSDSYAAIPSEDRPLVQKDPFVPTPIIPYPPGGTPPTPPTWTGPYNTQLTVGTIYCSGFPRDDKGVAGPFGSTATNFGSYDKDTDTWGSYTSLGDWVPKVWTGDTSLIEQSAIWRAVRAGVPVADFWALAPHASTWGNAQTGAWRNMACSAGDSLPAVFVGAAYADPGRMSLENALYDYVVPYYLALKAYADGNYVDAAVKAAIDAQNAANALADVARLQLWVDGVDADTVAKRNTECDRWDQARRASREVDAEVLYLSVVKELEKAFSSKWLSNLVLSPNYIPAGPLLDRYFIEATKRTTTGGGDTSSETTETVTYLVRGTDQQGLPTERKVTGTMVKRQLFAPTGSCAVRNGTAEVFTQYTFTNYWLGDPEADIRSDFPASDVHGRGYFVSGTGTVRTETPLYTNNLSVVVPPELGGLIKRPPKPAKQKNTLFLDLGFPIGAVVKLLVLKYMMWRPEAAAYVPTAGYVDVAPTTTCSWGDCQDSNFTSRTNTTIVAKEVFLDSVVTVTRTSAGWSTPKVVKYGVSLAKIKMPNTPRESYHENVTLGIPHAKFPDLIASVFGMPSAYHPVPPTQSLDSAFTSAYRKKVVAEKAVPELKDCSTVVQLADRIILEAVAAADKPPPDPPLT